MFRLVRKSLILKLVIYLSLAVAVPLAVSSYFGFSKAKDYLKEAESNKVRLVWEAKRSELDSWIRSSIDELTLWASTRRIRSSFDFLAQVDRQSKEFRDNLEILSEYCETYLRVKTPERGFDDLLLVDRETGKVVYTQNKLSDDQADLKTGTLKDSGLAKVWGLVVKHEKPALADFSMYAPAGTPCAFLGVPVSNVSTRKFQGVLVARLNARHITRMLNLGEGSGDTAETYIVGQDGLMRSQSRFETDSTVFKKTIDTEATRLGFQGKKGQLIAKDYRGEINFTFSGPIGLNKYKDFVADFDWVLVSEVDEQEALAPTRALMAQSLWFALASPTLAAFIAFLLARSIAKPISTIASISGAAVRGDLSMELPETGRIDEIGALTTAFNLMIETLRNQTTRLREGINTLSTAAMEISTTVAQVARSTAQTCVAVAETAATVEQVRQSAQLATEKSKKVAQVAQEAVTISESGQQATEESVARIYAIRDQMESISGTVVKLSAHSKAIDQIVATVQDLADQSNLLAVNASIEAARAGDHGKGFAVVAEEIKSLADQSKQATQQIRSILDDTQKWVGIVVMNTEQGLKAVQAGVEQSKLAGGAIETLKGSVVASSQAASVIAATSEQQSTGVGQVAAAMASIDKAMQQISDGTTQLYDAANRLSDLARELQKMVETYEV